MGVEFNLRNLGTQRPVWVVVIVFAKIYFENKFFVLLIFKNLSPTPEVNFVLAGRGASVRTVTMIVYVSFGVGIGRQVVTSRSVTNNAFFSISTRGGCDGRGM